MEKYIYNEQSNVRIAGRSEEFGDNYEEAILGILKTLDEF